MTSKDRIENQSIINNEYRCYICGSPVNLDLHHTPGGSYRKLADEDGLFLALCHYHHKKLHDTGEDFGGVQYFAEFMLPRGWAISDHYYKGADI